MKENTLLFYKERMLQVMLYIQQHLDEDLPLEQMAQVAHLSPYHFHRIFHGMVGESVGEHVRRLRLERAAGYLKNSRRPVTRLAFEAGYQTHEAFTRAFRSLFGVSPSQFRKEQGAYSFKEPPSGVHYNPAGKLEDFKLDAWGENMKTVSVEKVEPMRVAFVRHIGPYQECHGAWEKLMMWAGPKGLMQPGFKCLGVSYDDPDVTPPEKIRYDACITVDESVQGEGEIGIQVVGGGEYAKVTHEGPYENLNETYKMICGQWGPQNGREFRTDPCFEIYFNSPEDTAPADLVTDVYVPLEPK